MHACKAYWNKYFLHVGGLSIQSTLCTTCPFRSGEDGFVSEWSLEASIRTHLWNYKILSFREKIQGQVRELQKPYYHCGNHGFVCLLILSTNNFFCFICILIRSWSQREQRNLVNLALWLCLLLMRKKKKLSRLVSFECSQIIYRGNLGVYVNLLLFKQQIYLKDIF